MLSARIYSVVLCGVMHMVLGLGDEKGDRNDAFGLGWELGMLRFFCPSGELGGERENSVPYIKGIFGLDRLWPLGVKWAMPATGTSARAPSPPLASTQALETTKEGPQSRCGSSHASTGISPQIKAVKARVTTSAHKTSIRLTKSYRP